VSTQTIPILTPDQYLEIERKADYKSEYIDGAMFGEKFRFYRTIPGFSEYLLIAQDSIHAEHYQRRSDGAWILRELTSEDDRIQLDSIECRLCWAHYTSVSSSARPANLQMWDGQSCMQPPFQPASPLRNSSRQKHVSEPGRNRVYGYLWLACSMSFATVDPGLTGSIMTMWLAWMIILSGACHSLPRLTRMLDCCFVWGLTLL
jgi:hypothetical protein